MKTYVVAKVPHGNKSSLEGIYAVLDAETGRIAWADTSKKEIRDNLAIMQSITEYNEHYKNLVVSVRTAVYIDWSRGLVGCFLYNMTKPIVPRISLDKIVWYEVEELKEMKSLTINFTETFEKLTSTTKDINIEKVGTRSRKTKKTISKNNIVRLTADGDDIDTIHNIQESNNSKKETDIKEDNTEIISNTSNDNGEALFIQEQEDENNYTEDSIGNKQETKENILKESDIQKDSRNKAEDNGIYINIMKIMLEGNKISLPIDIFNSLEKGPIYPIFSDFNTGNRVAIVDIYVDKAEKYKKITVCITAKNSCRYIDIEILKEYNSSELPIGFKDDFKRDYLKWYKSTLHVRL